MQNGQEEGKQGGTTERSHAASEFWAWGFAWSPASPGYFLPDLPVKSKQYGNQKYRNEDNWAKEEDLTFSSYLLLFPVENFDFALLRNILQLLKKRLSL